MYNNVKQNQAIVYDPEILTKIKEMVKEGFEKIKSFVKIKSSKFDVYYELEEKFNNITEILEKYEFFEDELIYFLLITDQILYIIYQNCENASFGHCSFALELLDFFTEIWNAKIELTKNFTDEELKRLKLPRLEEVVDFCGIFYGIH